MSEARRVAKLETDTDNMVKSDMNKGNVEVAEAIKALQSQLADLRKIVQAAKVSGDDAIPVRRRQ